MPKKFYLAAWLVLIVAVVVIVQPFSLYFLNDDFIYVSKSTQFNYLYRTAFRPVSDITLFLNNVLSGKNSWAYHLTNLGFHGLSTWLVYAFVKRLYALRHLPQGAFVTNLAAAFFWCYPFHSESIFWIIGRGGSMVTIVFLASMLSIMHQQNGIKNWMASILLFVVGLFTYESSWLLPFAIAIWLLYYYGHPKKIPAADKKGWWFMLLLLLLSFFARYLLIGNFIGTPYLNTDHFQLNPIKHCYNFATGFFRSFLPPTAATVLFVVMAAALMIVLFVAIRKSYRQQIFWKANALPGLLFLLCLTPIFILAVSTHTTESERFLYLPSAFLCMWLAMWLVHHLSVLCVKKVAPVLLVGMLILLYTASVPYKLASQWTSTSLAAIAGHPGTYTAIVAYNVPTNYKGGFIFRLGLEEGIRWQAPNVYFDTLIIASSVQVEKNKKLTIPKDDLLQWPLIPDNLKARKNLHLYWKENLLYIQETNGLQ